MNATSNRDSRQTSVGRPETGPAPATLAADERTRAPRTPIRHKEHWDRSARRFGVFGLGVFAVAIVVLLVGARVASAQETPDSPEEVPPPTVFHTPPTSLAAGEATQLHAVIATDWALERTWAGLQVPDEVSADARARFRDTCTRTGNTLAADDHDVCEIEFLRDSATTFSAPIPGRLLQPPGVAYFIASRADDGEVVLRFASPAQPWGVSVRGESAETIRRDRLARHDGHTSEIRVLGEFTSFGQTMQPRAMLNPDEDPVPIDSFTDWFWSTNAEYTYRPLKMLYAFRFGVNVIRGSIPRVDNVKIDRVNDSPGMNSGYGEVDFEFHRNFSVAGRVSLGATEEGFAAGAGGLVRIGPSWGSHLELGLDWISRMGGRYFLSFAWNTIPRVPMAFTVEATQLPQTKYQIQSANEWENEYEPELGTRMFLDVGFEVNKNLTLGVRGGFANRQESVEGGFTSGLNASFEF